MSSSTRSAPHNLDAQADEDVPKPPPSDSPSRREVWPGPRLHPDTAKPWSRAMTNRSRVMLLLGGFFVVMADGSSRQLPKTFNPQTFNAMATMAGGEPVNW